MCVESALPASTVPAELLTSNACWAASVTNFDRYFFHNSAQGQSPRVLWIGCSDSRVPESVITASKPGAIFTTRNIANQFPVGDLSAHSVLQYAVNGPPNANHVIVVGHTRCGGVEGALNAARDGAAIMAPLDQWLAPLVKRIKGMPDLPNQTFFNVAKESVKMQIENICDSTPMKSVKKTVYVHGWMYHLENGRLEDLYLTEEIKPSI